MGLWPSGTCLRCLAKKIGNYFFEGRFCRFRRVMFRVCDLFFGVLEIDRRLL